MGPVSEDLYDVVVVGGGAAGLSAGLILAQAQCRMAVVDAGVPRNRFDGQMHGYLSRDGLAPQEFLRLGRQEVADAGAELIQARVTGAEREGDEQAPRFTLHTDQGHALRTRRVVVATGLTDELPAVEGLDPYWGHAVFHCPYCHGVQITSDLVVGVLAVGPDSVMEAHLLLRWADQVVLPTDDRVELSAEERAGLDARGISVVEGKVVAVEGDGELLHTHQHTGAEPVPQVVDQFFTPDVAFHTWDLARSSGQDDTLDQDLVRDSLAGMRAQDELIRSSGQFGQQQPVPKDATDQDRLFAFLGRDPRWRP